MEVVLLGALAGMAFGAYTVAIRVAMGHRRDAAAGGAIASIGAFLVVLAVAFNEYWRQIGVRRKRFFSGPLGLLAIGILAALMGTVLAVMFGAKTGGIAAVVTVTLLLAVAVLERRRATT